MTRLRSIACLALVGAVVAGASCKDQDIPYLTAPTSIPNSPVGIQNGMTGLFSSTRTDIGSYIILMSGFGRDAANYTNNEPRFLTYNIGIAPITNTWISVWANEYTDVLQARAILSTLPSVEPAYTAQQNASLTGIVQTIEAFNYMLVAEVHDTVGAAIQNGTPGVPPAFCNQDVWAYIVSLLDSANVQLNVAGSTPPPVVLPPGFSAVGAISGPSTQPGSFAAFNRALAAKAGLELAYAIARSNPGTSPGLMTPGTPDPSALTRADSAMLSSALYSPGSLGPNPAGGFLQDGFTVLTDFSSASGDQSNPINGVYATWWMMNDMKAYQDTLNDLRWKAKFVLDTVSTIQQPTYNSSAAPYHYNMYPNVSSPIPIVRNEELTLVRAQIQMGMGNYTTAATLVNTVRTAVGGLGPVAIANDYVDTRNALMHEQQISTTNEASGDRTIAIRMYGLAAVADTTWGSADFHTTVDPIPFTETSGRGGTFVTSCPAPAIF